MPKSHLDLAFRYALSQPQVACAVIGMATQQELRENLSRARRFTSLRRNEGNQLELVGKQMAKDWGAHFGAVT